MLLTQICAMDLLKKYEIDFPKTAVIRDSSELWKLSFPGPYVLKVDSPDAIHKTDLGLVFVGVEHDEVKEKIELLEKKISENKIGEHSFLIQEKVKGAEFLIGMKRDSAFGPVIVFGMGGILVEVIKDVSMRIAP
ncbi:MAG: hypothetical protein HGA85_08800, partial [Nanoarchaeota archaeon]|nr:hypothetical protein [Nanoarchaeota archaeon]